MFASNSMNSRGYSAGRNNGNTIAEMDSSLTQRLVFFVIVGATIYQTLLCLVHTHLFRISGTLVGFTEFLIYLACFSLLIRRIQLDFVAIVTLLFAYLLLLAVLRSALDAKGFRDMMIPILFYWLGRSFGTIRTGDTILKVVLAVVLFFGCFEMFFLSLYSKVFNVFSYYGSQGGLAGVTNWAKDSVMALNSVRPEGIGRTILPGLLGSNRVSSVFMEPVSLGNFAVIVAAWGLSKGRDEIKSMFFYLFCAAIMITMADSRYGLAAVFVLVMMRLLVPARLGVITIVTPLVAMAILVGTVWSGYSHYGDNMLGRFLNSGRVLLSFNAGDLLGLGRYAMTYGDMGYAVALTRFGMILCAVLWIGFWLIRMQDDRGLRFRAYVAIYSSMILMISGTSFFALKTAGLLWFLVGCCAVADASLKEPAAKRTRNPGQQL